LSVKFLASSISFDDHVRHFVTTFVGSKAALALQALAAAADDVALFALARVDNAVLAMGAEGAGHVGERRFKG
jgi:hypothetical protein